MELAEHAHQLLWLHSVDEARPAPKVGEEHRDLTAVTSQNRVFSRRDDRVGKGAPTEGATGFVEQHLTPRVEFLRTQVISTGLFDHDLALLRGSGDPGFLSIRVRNGDRLVWLTWAVQRDLRVPMDPQPATPGAGQRPPRDLGPPRRSDVVAGEHVGGPGSRDVRPVQVSGLAPTPSRSGLGPSLTVGAREWALLPEPAKDLILLGRRVDEAFYELTTDEARALAEALIEGGLQPLTVPMGEAVVRFGLEDPYEPGHSLSVYFGPVLPHGEAIFLGPG